MKAAHSHINGKVVEDWKGKEVRFRLYFGQERLIGT